MIKYSVGGNLWRYGAAALLVALATIVRLKFLQTFALSHPFLTFYPAVFIAALCCGLGGGLLATVLSVVMVAYFLMQPVGSLFIRDPAEQLYAAIFLLQGFLLSYLADKVNRVKLAKAQAETVRERQRAEEKLGESEKLRQSEQRLRLALEGGEMGMWQWDTCSNQVQCDGKECELLGLPAREGSLPVHAFLENLHPKDALAFKLALHVALERETDFLQESRVVGAGGETRWLVSRGRTFQDATAEKALIVGVSYDVTASRSAEEALKRSEAEARARADELAVLMDTFPAMVFISRDPECRHMLTSQKARLMMRVPEGANVSMSAPEGERPTCYRTMKDGRELPPEQLPMQMAARGQEIHNFELTLLFQDGTSCDILGDAMPLYDGHGNARGAVGVFLDITERKRIQTELQKESEERMRAIEALRERDRMLIQQGRLVAMGEMIGNIAHQWRQPLNSIGLIVQELPIVYPTDEFSEEYLKSMVDKAMVLILYMSQTIDDFSNFFKPGRQQTEFKVREAVDKTICLIEESFKRLEIGIEVEESGDPSVYGYPNEFSQVLLNLFLNSRDAFLERPKTEERRIRVRVFPQPPLAVVVISDNAGGIPEESLAKIFDPYFTTKEPAKGTGIGLFIAKNIIERHMKGSITARNTDSGAEFRIEIKAR